MILLSALVIAASFLLPNSSFSTPSTQRPVSTHPVLDCVINSLSAKTFIKAEIVQGWQKTYLEELRNHLGKDAPLIENLTLNAEANPSRINEAIRDIKEGPQDIQHLSVYAKQLLTGRGIDFVAVKRNDVEQIFIIPGTQTALNQYAAVVWANGSPAFVAFDLQATVSAIASPTQVMLGKNALLTAKLSPYEAFLSQLPKDAPSADKFYSNRLHDPAVTVDPVDLPTHDRFAREPFSPSSRPDSTPLKPELMKRAHEMNASKNAAFRPLITGFSDYVRSVSPERLKALRKESSERVVGPIKNLSRQITLEVRKPKYQEIGYDQARYKVFIKSVPPALRTQIETEPGYKSNIQRIFNLYGFQFAEADPVKGPLKKATQSVFVVPKNQPEDMLATLNLAHGGVGEYGAEFQKKLAQTTAILIDLAQSPEFTQQAKQMEKNVEGLAFARKGDDSLERKNFTDAQRTLIEGIVSIYQSLTFLTASKIEGLTGKALVNKLLAESGPNSSSFINSFSRIAPAGFIGPRGQLGEYFPHPIKLSENGNLVPTEGLKDFLLDQRNRQNAGINSGRLEANVSGGGCPAGLAGCDGNKTTSVQMISNLFRDVFNQLD